MPQGSIFFAVYESTKTLLDYMAGASPEVCSTHCACGGVAECSFFAIVPTFMLSIWLCQSFVAMTSSFV